MTNGSGNLETAPRRIPTTIRDALDEVKEDIKRHGGRININKAVNWVRRRSGLSTTDTNWLKERSHVRSELTDALASDMEEAQGIAAAATGAERTAQESAEKSPEAAEELKDKVTKGVEEVFGKKHTAGIIGMLVAWLKTDNPDSWLAKILEKWFGLESTEEKIANLKKETDDFIEKGNWKEAEASLKEIEELGKDNKDVKEYVQATRAKIKKGKAEKLAEKGKADKPKPEEAPEELSEQQKKYKKYVDLFKKKNWTLDTTTLDEDLKKLEGKGVNSSEIAGLVERADVEGSNLKRILAEVKLAISDKYNDFKLRLTDLLFQKSGLAGKAKINKIIAVIKNENDEYKLDKTPTAIRSFLN